MPFTDHIAAIPFSPNTTRGSGVLPPMLRAMGHILYLNACLSDPAIEVTVEQARRELIDAQEHWNARSTPELSTGATAALAHITAALTDALAEYDNWGVEQRTNNLRDLANRIVAICSHFDREFIGITISDPGAAL